MAFLYKRIKVSGLSHIMCTLLKAGPWFARSRSLVSWTYQWSHCWSQLASAGRLRWTRWNPWLKKQFIIACKRISTWLYEGVLDSEHEGLELEHHWIQQHDIRGFDVLLDQDVDLVLLVAVLPEVLAGREYHRELQEVGAVVVNVEVLDPRG